jgi:hypothetical protein
MKMRRFIVALPALAALAAAGSMFGATAARAADPVCLAEGTDGGVRCDFETLAQCQATLSGMGGVCESLPTGTGAVMKTKMPANGLPFTHMFKAKK